VRSHLFLAVLAITVVLWAPRDAAALCDLAGPYLGTGPRLPQGCPLHIFRSDMPLFPGNPPPTRPPSVTVQRGSQYVDVTGSPQLELTTLMVERTIVDCQLQPINVNRESLLFQRWAVQPVGVQVGELIGIGNGWFGGIEIVESEPCAAPITPQLACAESLGCFEPPPFDESFNSSGCAARGAGAGGGLPAGLALLGLALIGRRPRRRQRRRT
jgi:MYXO-CTERM domain-containing protein